MYNKLTRCLPVQRNLKRGPMWGFECQVPRLSTLERLITVTAKCWQWQLEAARRHRDTGTLAGVAGASLGWYAGPAPGLHFAIPDRRTLNKPSPTQT